MSHQQKGGRGGGRFGGRGRGGREGGGRGRGRGGGAGPSDFGGLWDPTVKWFFEDADGGGGGGGAPPKGGLEKGIKKVADDLSNCVETNNVEAKYEGITRELAELKEKLHYSAVKAEPEEETLNSKNPENILKSRMRLYYVRVD